tara:strand:- start:89 stop:328 length:240 start_codon:yes stop_codon:yes gene_type:complete
MDIKQEFREEKNMDVYARNVNDGNFSNVYVKWLEAKINYTHCCKSDSELLAEHKCKFYVNASWSYLKCDCGKRIKSSEG